MYPSSGHSGYVSSVAFSPDGTKVVTGSKDSTVKIWNVESGDVLHTLSGEREYDDDMRIQNLCFIFYVEYRLKFFSLF